MRLFAAAAALVLFAGLALAGEYTGYLKKADRDSIVIDVDGAEKTLKVKDGDRVRVDIKGKKTSVDTYDKLTTTKIGKKGIRVTVETEGEGAKETVKSIKSAPKKKVE